MQVLEDANCGVPEYSAMVDAQVMGRARVLLGEREVKRDLLLEREQKNNWMVGWHRRWERIPVVEYGLPLPEGGL